MKRAVLITILLVATATVAQRSSPATGASYEANGTVVHALTGEPLAGVTVTLSLSPTAEPEQQRVFDTAPRYLPPTRSEIRPVVTSSDGRFRFPGLAPGKYSLAGARRGFSQQAFDQHEQYSTAIIVGPDKDASNLVFRLTPDSSIGGRIVDEHNEPVPNAQVLLFRDGLQNGRRGIYRVQQTNSSDEGVYRFAHLRQGKFYIAVEATPWYAQYGNMRGRVNAMRDGAGGASAQQVDDGSSALDFAFPVTFHPGVTDSARAEAIDLKAGQRETVDFALGAIPSLHVRINTGAGEPGQAVTATLMQQIFDSPDLGQRGRNMSYNQGVIEISGVTPGHYLLQLHSNSQNRFPPTPLSAREIDINSSMEVNANDVPTGVNVTGTLRFEGPSSSDTSRVVLRRRGFAAPVQLTVGPKGEISSSQPVPPDTYDVAVPVNGYQISQVAVSGGRLKGQSVQIGTSDVRLTLVAAKASARVEGFARKGGKPLAGAMIVLVPEDVDRPLLYRRDQSDSDGSFLLAAVTPGKYTVVAIENGWDLEWSKPEVIRPYLAAGSAVQVVVDGRYKVDVTAQ